nr:MAG TPA: hypothetical protein [Caudoviricetes sp.]
MPSILKRTRKIKMIRYQLELIIANGAHVITYQVSKD